VNEQEFKQLRLAADATAARTLMLWAATVLNKTLPTEPNLRAECIAAWQRKLASAKADYLQMTFPEMPPAVSDLWAGEAQESFDRLAVEFETRFSANET
jgi:hypothetical protein